MKRFLLCVVLLAAGWGCVNAQVSAYVFSSTLSTFTPISNGTVLGSPNNDTHTFSRMEIGFYFCYNGQVYSEFGVSTDGYVVMGPTSNATTSTGPLSSGSENNVIAGMGCNLEGHPGSKLQYATVGTAPNRELVVQWSDYGGGGLNADTFNFQIRLRETSNSIDVIYGHCVPTQARTPQVGLRGNNNTDYNNRRVIAGTQTWPTSIAGTANNSNCAINSTTPVFPPSGLKYTWSPASTPNAPVNMSFTAVGFTTTTVRWNDNSTNEQSFALFRSTDNVNFSFVTSLNSTSVATTGTLYQFAQTDLFAGTLYYYRVMAVSNSGSSFLAGQQMTLSGTMCGTYTIGPAGNYSSIGAAFSALAANGLSCGVVLELLPAYLSSVETFPLTVPVLPTSAALPVTLRPALGATGLMIASSAVQTILLNGTDYLRIDGRPGGIGSVSELNIDNSSLTGFALVMQNGTQYNRFTYVKFTGVNTNASLPFGIVYFGNATTTAGNEGNIFDHCEFCGGATSPGSLFIGSQSSGKVSRNDTITNCTFHDWHAPNDINYAINLGNLMAEWVISNNSLYQTDSLDPATSGECVGILINSGATGSEHKITGNFIGGSGPQCSGSHPQGWGSYFTGIFLYCPNGQPPTVVRDNLITNIIVGDGSNSTTDPFFMGLRITSGDGQFINNTIGSPTDSAAIIVSRSSGSTAVIGIGISITTTDGTVLVDSNRVGGMYIKTPVNRTASGYGIHIASATGGFVVSNNLVGSRTCPNSISNTQSTGNNVAGSKIYGISTGANVGVFSLVENNEVANLSNRAQGTAIIQTVGILSYDGRTIIRNNTIHHLSSAGGQTNGFKDCSLIGISIDNLTSEKQTVSNNRVYSCRNISSSSGSCSIIGIFCAMDDGPRHLIDGNHIFDLYSATNSSCMSFGITADGGTAMYCNNMIVLGLDSAGNSRSNAQGFAGIYKYTTSATAFYHNSVRLSGNQTTSGVGITYVFARGQTGADTLRNNIFEHSRITLATQANVCVWLLDTSNIVLDYNDYYVSPANYLGRVSTSNFATLPTWQTRVNDEWNGMNENPNFVSGTDLHLNAAIPSFMESRAVASAVENDFDNDVRPGPVPSVNGGGVVSDIGADEFDGTFAHPDVSLPSLTSPATGCFTGPQTVTVTLENTGNVMIDFAHRPVTVSGSATGANPVVFTPVVINSGTLLPGGQMPVVLSTNYTMSAMGTYTFHANVTMSGDSITTNNVMLPDSFIVSSGITMLFNAPVCSGDTFLLTVNGFTEGGTVQWQSSPDSTTWTNIAGATNDSLSTFTNDTTFYRAMICGAYYSTVIVIHVGQVPQPQVQSAQVCDSGTVILQASGPGIIDWYNQPSGGSSLFTGSAFSVFVNASATYYAALTQGSCQSARTVATVRVDPSPVVSLGNDTSLCGSLLLDAGNAGSSYAWNDGTVAQTILADTTGNWWVQLTDTNGCVTADTIFVQANSFPVVALGLPLDTVCWSGGTITLGGENPTGGVFSGPGVSGNTFDPMNATVGFNTITYVYTDANGCAGTSLDSMYVDLCLDVISANDNPHLNVYPDPVTGHELFFTGLPADEPVELYFVDPLGRTVFTRTLTTGSTVTAVELPEQLPPGLYYVHIIGNTFSNTIPVVIEVR